MSFGAGGRQMPDQALGGDMRLFLTFWAVLAGMTVPTLASGPDDYIQRFFVRWVGGGEVKLSLNGSPWRVSCRLNPTGSENAVTLSGACRLKFLFFLSNSIEAKLKYDAASGAYSGTYVVDGGPPAILSGRRDGDLLTLNVRWPKPVNDHLDAVIKIFNDSRLFTLTTIDPIGIDGKAVVTSDLSFAAQ
jgi:hypothetical protein